MAESFTALVRGPVSTYPRGFPSVISAWVVVVAGLAGFGWAEIIGPWQWWYFGPAFGGLIIAGITIITTMTTIRRPAFRADRNGIRLGVRTEHPRPRHRQAQLWWSDVRQLRIEPQGYGLVLEISLGPAARIDRRRGPVRQALLACGMFLLPGAVGRGTPRLTEARRSDPHYRVQLCDVAPEELGVVLAGLAMPEVEIIVISRRYGPVMARRPQPAAPPERQTPARAVAALGGTARTGGARPVSGGRPEPGVRPAVAWPANIRPGAAGRIGPAPRPASAPRPVWHVSLPGPPPHPERAARSAKPGATQPAA